MRRIHTVEGLAPPAGPYTFATITESGLVYTAGQIAQGPDGQLVTGGVEAQTHQVMYNLGLILQAAGVGPDNETCFRNIVESNIFLRRIEDFSAVNQAYGEYFPERECPVRATVQAGIPLEGLVEIKMVAELSRSS